MAMYLSSCPDGSTVRRDVQVSTRRPRNFAQRTKLRCTVYQTDERCSDAMYKKQPRKQHPDTGNRRQEREKAAETTYSNPIREAARSQKPAALGGQKRRPASTLHRAAAGTAPLWPDGELTHTRTPPSPPVQDFFYS
jgi:hypothetical protein